VAINCKKIDFPLFTDDKLEKKYLEKIFFSTNTMHMILITKPIRLIISTVQRDDFQTNLGENKQEPLIWCIW
jgi:hypothetical protein